MKPIVVLKFGGTSVAAEAGRRAAARHIGELRRQGCDTVVVVSAMGRRGDPYATDTLLDLMDRLRAPVHTPDMLASCGETISACIFAQTLEELEIPAWPMNAFTANIWSGSEYGSAEISGMDTRKVMDILQKGRVPVITGFQGVSPGNEITTLGRGGSDTSAVAIGGFLKAREVQIYTDVPGVAVTDPRIINDVRYLPEISYEDCLLLAECGSKVVHPRAVRVAKEKRITLWVKSTFNNQAGTRIGPVQKPITGLIGIAGADCGDGERIISYLSRGVEVSCIIPEHCTFISEKETADGGRLVQFSTDEARAQDVIRAIYQNYT